MLFTMRETEPQPGRYSIPCKVTPGMFGRRVVAALETPDGNTIQAIVDKNCIRVGQALQPGEEVLGRIQVQVVAWGTGKCLVELPQPGGIDGRRLWVPQADLQER